MISVILDGKAMGSIYRKGFARTENVRERWLEKMCSASPSVKRAVLWFGPSLAFCPESFVLLLTQNKTILPGLYGGCIYNFGLWVSWFTHEMWFRGVVTLQLFQCENYREVLALSVDELRVLIQYIRITNTQVLLHLHWSETWVGCREEVKI